MFDAHDGFGSVPPRERALSHVPTHRIRLREPQGVRVERVRGHQIQGDVERTRAHVLGWHAGRLGRLGQDTRAGFVQSGLLDCGPRPGRD